MFDDCKTAALGLYYLATLPLRKGVERERRVSGAMPIISLLYHRVADEHPSAWTISWKNFRRQMEWLKERFKFVTLAEAQRRIRLGRNSDPVVSLTFDDGYADNCHRAIPWLIEQKIPVTYFVTTDNILTGNPFPHDVERNCLLQPNTVDQIREMAGAGVEIGAHSRSHSDLGNLSTDELVHEIVGSKYDLESILDQPVRYFAFPYGLHHNICATGFAIAHQAGFRGVCSAYGAYNMPGNDGFHIQRIHGDPEWWRFVNWMTLDPRKFRMQRNFDPGNYRKLSEQMANALSVQGGS